MGLDIFDFLFYCDSTYNNSSNVCFIQRKESKIVNKEIILPEFVQLFIGKAEENNFPVAVLLKTPRKGEVVSGPMDDMESKLHEYATIHKCEGDVDSLGALYDYKIDNNLDIMCFFPESKIEELILELNALDGYEVIQRY